MPVTLIAAFSAFLIKFDYGYIIGRDPSVAFLFVLVAAKFAEVRRANDATLLLCLAAFLLLTQYFYSQTIIAALVTLPAVIALGYSLSILRDPENPSQTNEQLKLVGTLLVQGVPLAALLFVVFPRLPGPLWTLPEDAMGTTGLSDSMSPGTIGQLSQSAAVAFRVEFDGAPPPPSQRYWRGPVLTQFDGQNWTTSPVLLPATPQYTGPESQILSYTVMLQPHRQRWLFALDSAISLPRSSDIVLSSSVSPTHQSPAALGKLMSDGQMIANQPVSQVLRYRQRSVLNDAMATARYPSDNTLSLPGKNTRTQQFADDLRSTVDSDLDYAQAVLRHFNQEAFYYTLKPQLLGDKPVDEFLFDSRAGFCEHYAAAFVVLMRAAGIPSRVVTGYQGGVMNEDYMIVRQSDAHAWAESYIDGAWRRYDPTASVAPSRIEQGLAAALPNESSVPRLARQQAGWLRNTQLRWDAMNHHWQRLVVDFDNDSQGKLWERLGLPKPALWQLTIIVMLIAGVWCAFVLGLPSLRRSKLPANEQLWQRLCRLLAGHGVVRGVNESPNEFMHRAVLQWPNQSIRLQALSAQFEVLRFTLLDENSAKTVHKQTRRMLRSLHYALKLDALLRRPNEWFQLFLRRTDSASLSAGTSAKHYAMYEVDTRRKP